MTAAGRDPWLVLGIERGAGLIEVKRAYRRLAKASHPDAAGPAALPRFLAIQSAYQAILVEHAAARTAARATGASGAAGRSSASGPGGARAAWQERRTGRGTGRGAGQEPPAGRARDGAGSAAGQRPGQRQDDGRAAGDAARERGGADARPRRAHLGSTSYDDAVDVEPRWDGGSWYGDGMGTYWTVNPKEYADPRKHGPEYQARARPWPEQAGQDGPGEPSDPNGLDGGAAGAPPSDPRAAAGPDRFGGFRVAPDAPADGDLGRPAPRSGSPAAADAPTRSSARPREPGGAEEPSAAATTPPGTGDRAPAHTVEAAAHRSPLRSLAGRIGRLGR